MTARRRGLILASCFVAGVIVALPPIPQDLEYHAFADQRTVFGVRNALNVLSNVPFFAVGIAGLIVLRRTAASISPPMERWHVRSYTALFIGLALTAFGSSYYHLAPDNARLVWDRLPMTIGFMGLLTAIVGERVSGRAAAALLAPLLALGAFSVALWAWTDDLRLYGVVQFGSLLGVLLLLVFYTAPYGDTRYVWWALGFYALAKLFEAADRPIFDLGGIVSGHSLKHVAAAAGLVPLIVMLSARRSRI
jgi:hypothetical protein